MSRGSQAEIAHRVLLASLLVFLASSCGVLASAFLFENVPGRAFLNTQLPCPSSSALRSSSEGAKGAGAGAERHAPLSRPEVESWLADVPVYAITDAAEGGVVLLTPPDSPGSGVAYFFLTRAMADGTLEQLAATTPEADWTVGAFSLGMIWFDLLDKPITTSDVKSKLFGGGDSSEDSNVNRESVEYRLVPDPRDLAAARTHVAQATGGEDAGGAFESPYDQVPVFMDLQMRIETDEGGVKDEEKEAGGSLPMYLSVGDMISTVREFMGSNPSYEAAVNVSDLRTLVMQMQEEKAGVDFRRTVLIPPLAASGRSSGGDDDGEYEPSMNSDWSG